MDELGMTMILCARSMSARFCDDQNVMPGNLSNLMENFFYHD